jgi:hypothetical protein
MPYSPTGGINGITTRDYGTTPVNTGGQGELGNAKIDVKISTGNNMMTMYFVTLGVIVFMILLSACFELPSWIFLILIAFPVIYGCILCASPS